MMKRPHKTQQMCQERILDLGEIRVTARVVNHDSVVFHGMGMEGKISPLRVKSLQKKQKLSRKDAKARRNAE